MVHKVATWILTIVQDYGLTLLAPPVNQELGLGQTRVRGWNPIGFGRIS
jgi:hypothetical protein